MGSSTSALETAKLVRTIVSDDVAPAEAFVQLLNTVMTDAETTQAFPVEQLRKLRHLYTRNFAALLYRCIAAVAIVASKRHEVNTVSKPSSAVLTPELVIHFHSALRILRCALPVALEDGYTPVEGTADEEDNSLTTDAASPPVASNTAASGAAPAPPLTSRTESTQDFQRLFFVQGSTCDDDNPDDVFPVLPHQNMHLSPAQPYAKPVPLGSFLVWSLVECCFIRGLSLPEQAVQPAEPQMSVIHAEVDTGIMWCAGIASEDPIEAFASLSGGPSFSWAAPKLPVTRTQLLETLFITLSSPVYHEPGFRDTIFLEPLLSTTTVPLMPTLTVSMLNTILQYVPYGYLPYSSHLGVEEKVLVETCTMVLDAALSYLGIPVEPPLTDENIASSSESRRSHGAQRGSTKADASVSAHGLRGIERCRRSSEDCAESGRESDAAATSRSSETRRAPANAQQRTGSPPPPPAVTHGGPPRLVHSARKMLRDFTLTEAKVIVERMQGVLGVNAYASQTYLPTSQTRFSSLDELMVLFWKILDLSPTVLAQFGNSPRALDYVIPILDYALEVRRSPLYVYRFQLMVFALTRLSEVRGFVLRCNQACTAALPFLFPKMAPNCTYNDLIVSAVCIVMEMKDVAALNPLFPSCTVVLANMAPFITALGRVPSIKLVSVFGYAAYRCLRSGGNTPSPSSPSPPPNNNAATSSGTASEAAPPTASPLDTLHQAIMVNLCEAIASLLQYQPNGSLYLLASLVDHRAVVREVKDAYVVQRTKVLSAAFPLPFLINTLDAAVSAALPAVESTDALRKFTKYYMDTTSAQAVSNATAALERTSAFVPPVGMGEPGAGLAASDEAVDRLRSMTLVGVLPTPHSIIIRKFQATKSIEHWTETTFWTSAYIHSTPGTLGDRDSVKLVQFV